MKTTYIVPTLATIATAIRSSRRACRAEFQNIRWYPLTGQVVRDDTYTRLAGGNESQDDLGHAYRVSRDHGSVDELAEKILGYMQRDADEAAVPADVDKLLSKPPRRRDLREALAACCKQSNSKQTNV